MLTLAALFSMRPPILVHVPTELPVCRCPILLLVTPACEIMATLASVSILDPEVVGLRMKFPVAVKIPRT